MEDVPPHDIAALSHEQRRRPEGHGTNEGEYRQYRT